jgi:hypothetical protein
MDAKTTTPFTWSYSKLHGYETCPRKLYEEEILKCWPKERSELLDEGDEVHAALALALRDGSKLPLKFRMYEKWLTWVRELPGERLIERDAQWACTRQFQPTLWSAPDVWLRCKADVAVVDIPRKIGIIIDWKNGKSINVDPIQLTLTSLMALIQFPELGGVRADFVWLKEGEQTSQSVMRSEAADQWAELMPRVERYRQALATTNFPMTPNRLCGQYCAVKSCEHNGRT